MTTIKQIVIWICQPCLDGIGEECHTPGCAMFLHAVDLPFDSLVYDVIGQREDEETQTGPEGIAPAEPVG